MRVKPTTPGAVIRDPQTRRLLPDAGGDVPDTSFWRRRLLAGDVELVKEPAAPAEPPPTPRQPRTKAPASPGGEE